MRFAVLWQLVAQGMSWRQKVERILLISTNPGSSWSTVSEESEEEKRLNITRRSKSCIKNYLKTTSRNSRLQKWPKPSTAFQTKQPMNYNKKNGVMDRRFCPYSVCMFAKKSHLVQRRRLRKCGTFYFCF